MQIQVAKPIEYEMDEGAVFDKPVAFYQRPPDRDVVEITVWWMRENPYTTWVLSNEGEWEVVSEYGFARPTLTISGLEQLGSLGNTRPILRRESGESYPTYIYRVINERFSHIHAPV